MFFNLTGNKNVFVFSYLIRMSATNILRCATVLRCVNNLTRRHLSSFSSLIHIDKILPTQTSTFQLNSIMSPHLHNDDLFQFRGIHTTLCIYDKSKVENLIKKKEEQFGMYIFCMTYILCYMF